MTYCSSSTYIENILLYFILYSENHCISKLDKIGIFTDVKFHRSQKSLVTDISLYLHCRFWITSDVSIYLTSLNVSHFRNSNAYNSVIYEQKHKVWVFIFLERKEQYGTKIICVFIFFCIFALSLPAL